MGTMTTPDAPTIDVTTLLERSLAALRERGMTKFVLEDNNGSVCARGAIIAALGVDAIQSRGWEVWRSHQDVVGPAERLLSEAAGRFPGRSAYSYGADAIVAFNNHPETTQGEVEAVFEQAIAASRGEG